MSELQTRFKKHAKPTIVTGRGKTEQAHKDQCDMNLILRDYQKTGLMQHVKNHEGRYDDILVGDFQEAMFLVTRAQTMFSELPSNVRKRFANDPAEFLSFCQNPDNREELAEMGLLRGSDGLTGDGKPSGAPTIDPAPKAAQKGAQGADKEAKGS